MQHKQSCRYALLLGALVSLAIKPATAQEVPLKAPPVINDNWPFNVGTAAISPDKLFLAYSVGSGGLHLKDRQTAADNIIVNMANHGTTSSISDFRLMANG